MNKIYYNSDGWLCERYPYNISKTNKSLFIEVDDQTFSNTLCTPEHYCWRVNENKQLECVLYEEIPEEEILYNLRKKREDICFPIINRGQLWYDSLTKDQLNELSNWYQAWLNVTITKVEPETPEFLL